MSEKVLITGASGFIGYHIIQAALTYKLEVYAAVRKTSNVSHLKELPVEFVDLDYSDVKALSKHITDTSYQYIIHAAGVTAARSATEYQKYNTQFTINLAAAAAGKVKKFVFLSSLAAIGPLASEAGIITEGKSPQPITAYGESKLAAEKSLKQIQNLELVTLRPTAVYGPREKGIYLMFKQIANGFEPYIGKKAQNFSFVYAKDLARVTVNALFNGAGDYNISDGNKYNRYQLANITKDILNLRTLKLHIPVGLIKVIAAVAEGVGRYTKNAPSLNTDKVKELTAANWYCDITKAKNELGFAPQYDLRKGLHETLTWYKENKWL